MPKFIAFLQHLWAGVPPALHSLKFSTITVVGTLFAYMATDCDKYNNDGSCSVTALSAVELDPASLIPYLHHHWLALVVGAFILPAFRAAQGIKQSVAASTPPPPPGKV